MTRYWSFFWLGATSSLLGGAVTLPRNCTNGPQSRQCWRDGFDIFSDYTMPDVVPPGKLVEYDLTVTQQPISPDGYEILGTVFNGQYPGPLIEADWGDTVRITVRNNLTNYNGTAVHWHGIRQLMANYQDGVPGVTQCPIPPGESQVYEFRATQYGTSWYHSHYSMQYSNGLLGPIVIHGPSSANWDVDLGPLILSDWNHDDAFKLNWISLMGQLASIPTSTVLNGKGLYDCTQDDANCTGRTDLLEFTVTRGQRYKLAIANTGTLLTYNFWIDGHNMTIIEADFVPVEPYTIEVANVGIGQRYEMIVEANADSAHGSNFWIFAQYCAEPEVVPNNKVGVVRYDASDRSDPYTPDLSAQHWDAGCADPDLAALVPVVRKTVGSRSNSMEHADYLTLGEVGKLPTPWDQDPRVHLWTIKESPMYVNWTEPSLRRISANAESIFPPETVPVMLDFETGEWVYFVLTSNYTLEDVVVPRNLTPTVHPMHLHGHDFFILAQGHGPFTPDIVPKLDNPPRRDVVDVDIDGYAWIAFQVDNPGAWLLHCHIQYHAAEGLALQYIEQPNKIPGLLEDAGIMGDFSERCSAWGEYYNNVNIPMNDLQSDSGI